MFEFQRLRVQESAEERVPGREVCEDEAEAEAEAEAVEGMAAETEIGDRDAEVARVFM